MKLDINTMITQAYHISRCSSWKLSSKARIARAFKILQRIQQGEKQKRCHLKSDYRLWQATHFTTKNPINKPAVNKRTLLIAAVFHYVHPVEKDFSCQSKQLSRCCINFTHELKINFVQVQLSAGDPSTEIYFFKFWWHHQWCHTTLQPLKAQS